MEEPKDGDTVLATEDGEVVVEEPRGPRDLSEDKDDALEDDEEVVDDRKHGTTGLKRDTIEQKTFRVRLMHRELVGYPRVYVRAVHQVVAE